MFTAPKASLIGECDHEWQAEMTDLCDCELAGYCHSGVPGVLAHMENGRLAEGVGVQRCDHCRRFASDKHAHRELRRRGLA